MCAYLTVSPAWPYQSAAAERLLIHLVFTARDVLVRPEGFELWESLVPATRVTTTGAKFLGFRRPPA